ncbi:MAG: glycosyltransferase family 4 protein [Spongiibacteraceae bacterium]
MMALIGGAVISLILIGAYRQLALRYRWLDHPNQRSSHAVTTPRGAGIIFSSLIIIATSWQLHLQHMSFTPILIGAAIALAGWWDDIRGCAPQIRLVLYAAIALTATLLIADGPHLNLIAISLFALLGTLGVTWLINLYNFMDGINGLAALEAVFVLIAINWLGHSTVYGHTFSHTHLFASAILVGFLVWNFPAGKIFMGDAGSAFLGFFLGILALWSYQLQGPSVTVWLILLAIFIGDASYTLFVRIITRQKWHEAHRLHAYQQLATRLNANHFRTTCVLMIVNLGWLLPIAWLVQARTLHQVFGLALAYLPLIIGCYWLKAGIPAKAEV